MKPERKAVEWNGDWFPSQYELAKKLKVSTGRVSANITNGWKLKGHEVKLSRFKF